MKTVAYEQSLFRRWHDGPVVVIDTLGVGSAIYTGLAKYIIAGSNAEVGIILNTLPRPYAGTIYIFASDDFVSTIAAEYNDLDIVQVTV